MEFVSHRVKISNLEVGDHIYTWRTAFTYSHHGIYVGEHRVVHFTQHEDLSSSSLLPASCSFPASSSCSLSASLSSCSLPASSSCSLPASLSSCSLPVSSSSSSSCSCVPTTCQDPYCGYQQNNSGVIMSCLHCFLGNGSLYRFQYGVCWISFISKIRGGTCTTAKSDVIHRAIYLLYNGFGNYSAMTNNCEDFTLYCKTGLVVSSNGGSGQATWAVGLTASAIASAPLRLFFSNPAVIAVKVMTLVSGGMWLR